MRAWNGLIIPAKLDGRKIRRNAIISSQVIQITRRPDPIGEQAD